jgi:hypothetical protein
VWDDVEADLARLDEALKALFLVGYKERAVARARRKGVLAEG